MNLSKVIRGRGLGGVDRLSKKKRSVKGVGHIAGDCKSMAEVHHC